MLISMLLHGRFSQKNQNAYPNKKNIFLALRKTSTYISFQEYFLVWVTIYHIQVFLSSYYLVVLK